MYKQLWIACICLLASMALAASEQKTKPEPERTVYDDWFTLCAKPAGICTMNQIQYVDGEQGRSQVLHVHISKNRQDQLIMQLILPLGVVLPPGVLLKVDEGEEFRLPYHACTPEGCIAVVPVSEERLQMLRKGSQALIGFLPIGMDKTAVIKVSLKGFTRASNVVRNAAGH